MFGFRVEVNGNVEEFKLHKWNCKVYELHSLLSNGRV
jgi:hypothetical protein